MGPPSTGGTGLCIETFQVGAQVSKRVWPEGTGQASARRLFGGINDVLIYKDRTLRFWD